MATPVKYLINIMKWFIITLIAFSIVGFAFSRVKIFVEAYHDEIRQHENDLNIIELCKNATFRATTQIRYPNMCEEAEVHKIRDPVLNALATVVNVTYVCGYTSCQTLLHSWFDWFQSLGWPLMIILLLLSFLFPSALVHYVATLFDAFAERRYMQRLHQTGSSPYLLQTPTQHPLQPYPALTHEDSFYNQVNPYHPQTRPAMITVQDVHELRQRV